MSASSTVAPASAKSSKKTSKSSSSSSADTQQQTTDGSAVVKNEKKKIRRNNVLTMKKRPSLAADGTTKRRRRRDRAAQAVRFYQSNAGPLFHKGPFKAFVKKIHKGVKFTRRALQILQEACEHEQVQTMKLAEMVRQHSGKATLMGPAYDLAAAVYQGRLTHAH